MLIPAVGVTDKTNIKSMAWTVQAKDPSSPALTVGNADCATASKTGSTTTSGTTTSGNSTWNCALSVNSSSQQIGEAAYVLSVTVTDDKGNSSAALTSIIYTASTSGGSNVGSNGGTIGAGGLKASAGNNFTVASGAAAPLSCFAESGKAPYTYAWSITGNGGLPISLTSYSTAQTSFMAPVVSSPTAVGLKCVATDSLGATSTSTVNVTVAQTGNVAKLVADAGLAFNSAPGVNNPLHCVASGGVAPYSYQWRVSKNAGKNILLSAYGSQDSSFTAPAVTESAGVEFQCVVTDSSNSASVASLQATILATSNDAALVANAGPGLNKNPGQTVDLNGSATGWFDAKGAPIPGTTIAYKWESSDSRIVINNPSVANTTFVVPPDIIKDMNGNVWSGIPGDIAKPVVLKFKLTATAGTVVSTADVSFVIDPYPPFTLGISPPAQVNSPDTLTGIRPAAIMTASATTVNGSPTIYYRWTQLSGPITVAMGGQTTASMGFAPTIIGEYVFRLAVGYQPITVDYPGIYFADGVIAVK